MISGLVRSRRAHSRFPSYSRITRILSLRPYNVISPEEKRGGGEQAVVLDDAFVFSPEKSHELLKLDESLDRLGRIDPRQGKIVELLLPLVERLKLAAEVLGISPKTVKRDWSMAKAWLYGDLKASHGNVKGEVGIR